MKREWKRVGEHEAGWDQIRVEVERRLPTDQVRQLAGCVGYALRQVLHGEELSEPVKIAWKGRTNEKSIVRFYYDSTKSRSDDPKEAEAFELAARYIAEGTPVRTTDRAGAGTKGTRLCEGVGQVKVKFWVK